MTQSVYFTRDSSSLMSEESLLCCICLEVFSDPVTTPCGHNFCHSCLTQCWEGSQLCCCPMCKVKFTKRPEVNINSALSKIVEQLKQECTLDEPEVLSESKSHLESHSKVQKLQIHKLINPVDDLADYICQKHKKPLEMFCSDDQMCVCEFCIEGEHRNHAIIHIEEETGKMKTQLRMTKTEVQQMIRNRLKNIQELKHTVECSRTSTKTENTDSMDVFDSLIHSIESSKADLPEVMEKTHKSVEREAEGLIKDLEQEITVLKMRDIELRKLLDTKDHMHLLQIFSSVCTLAFTNNWLDIKMDNGLGVRSLWKALSQLLKTLNKTLEEIDIKRIQLDAVDVTLDPDTANDNLLLSRDLKKTKFENTKRKAPDNPKRFTYFYMVLGKQGFSSGRFYFEVKVSGKTHWNLGVVKESVNRKEKIEVTPQNGFWALGLRNENEYWANLSLISQGKMPQRIGVFVDYEEGLVSFHDLEARCHIYSFTGQSFADKLYPFINPFWDDEGKNVAPIIIAPITGMNFCSMK